LCGLKNLTRLNKSVYTTFVMSTNSAHQSNKSIVRSWGVHLSVVLTAWFRGRRCRRGCLQTALASAVACSVAWLAAVVAQIVLFAFLLDIRSEFWSSVSRVRFHRHKSVERFAILLKFVLARESALLSTLLHFSLELEVIDARSLNDEFIHGVRSFVFDKAVFDSVFESVVKQSCKVLRRSSRSGLRTF